MSDVCEWCGNLIDGEPFPCWCGQACDFGYCSETCQERDAE